MKRSPKPPPGAQPRAEPIPDTSSPNPSGLLPAQPTIEEIVRDHLAFLRGWLTRFGIRKEELDDATHDLVLRIWKSLPSYDPEHPAGLRPWLVRIAQRYSLQHRARAARQSARFVPISPELVALVDPSPRMDVRAEQSELAEELLRALPEKRRNVLLAHDVDGMTLDEIAVALSIPRGTVASRLRRARADVASAQMRAEAARRRRGLCVLFLDPRSLGAWEDGGTAAAPPVWPRLSGLSRRRGARFRRVGRLLAGIAAAAVLPCLATSLLAPDVTACALGAPSRIRAAWKPAGCELEGAAETPAAPIILPEPRRASAAFLAPNAGADGGAAAPLPRATSAAVTSLFERAPRERALAPREATGDEAFERRLVEEARAAVGQGDAARAVAPLGLRARRFPGGSFERQAEGLRAARER